MSEDTENIVPVREMKVYQSDDGRRIEQWSTVDKIEQIQEREFDEDQSTDKDELFVGVVNIMTSQGTKEIKFEIPTDTLEEAFDQYVELANQSLEELKKRVQEQTQQHAGEDGGGIVTAPASALNSIDSPE